MNKILFIGCGHMGFAMLKSWSEDKKNKFTIIDPLTYKKINSFYKRKIKAVKSINEIKNLEIFNIVIIAIKPQITAKVLKDYTQCKFNRKTIFISIVAGKKISYLNSFFSKTHKFIRAMPNMPAMISQGMTGLYGNNVITKNDKIIITKLFSKLGETLWLQTELDLNKVTAISGSGPGYVFYLIDAFEKGAINLGLGEKITKKLVSQTFIGSINLFLESKMTAEDLVKKISIKGGTTEAGLANFKKDKILQKNFKKVIQSSYSRSKKLEK